LKKISKQKIAEIYARALLNSEKDIKEAKSLLEQMQSLQTFLQENNKITEYFSSPLFSLSDKKELLDKFCREQQFLPLVQNFLHVVLENNRFSKIDVIISEFIEMYMEDCGYTYVTVQSVKELSKKQDNDLQNNLKKLLSKEVIIKYEIKPEILGGLVIRYDDNIIDDSIKNKISLIEKAMKGA